MQTEIAVLKEKVFYFERENAELKKEVREMSKDVDILLTSRETMLLKLDQIQKQLADIQGTVNKDSGWRGFFIDFIKAAAQIAVLVGAGKWLF
jgi:chromosome segregation ATPase